MKKNTDEKKRKTHRTHWPFFKNHLVRVKVQKRERRKVFEEKKKV